MNAHVRSPLRAGSIVVAVTLIVGCSGSSDNPGDLSVGGTSPSSVIGGSTAQGSQLSVSGGASSEVRPGATGGASVSNGGVINSGGASVYATGANGSVGGTSSTGGTTSSTGGTTSSTGGTTSSTGGTTSKGGTTSTGGTTSKGGTTSTTLPPASDPCIGWAAVDAEGVARTTGGEGGPVVAITTGEQLKSYRRDTAPRILRIMNDLTGEFELGPNKTVEGATKNVTIYGSLSFSGTASAILSNLIVRNLKINAVTSSEDGLDIRYAHHVCVEHCEFVDAPDGNLDIVSEANYVTVAYNKFYYTSAYHPLPGETSLNHRYSNLVGSSNTTNADRGKLKVTFHHNWWAEGVIERMPRVRFGDVHVFNNYYSSAGNNYCIAGGIETRLVVENNYFENVKDPHIFYDGDSTAQMAAAGNVYINVTGLKQSGQGASFSPPYKYALDPGNAVKAYVMANVGPR